MFHFDTCVKSQKKLITINGLINQICSTIYEAWLKPINIS